MTNPYQTPQSRLTDAPGPTARPDDDRVPAWPGPVGLVCAILGGLGVLGTGFQLISVVFVLVLARGGSAEMAPSAQMIESNMGMMIVLQVFTMALSIGLCVCAFGFLKRRPWARQFAMIWAGGKVLLALLNTGFGLLNLEANVSLMIETNPILQDFENFEGPFFYFQAFSVIFTFFYLAALPLFFFIFLGDRQVRGTVESWA